MNRQQAKRIIDRFPGRRLVVVGDLMLDEFIWGEVRRISPEAPVPVVEVRRESWHPGGAGNVVSNLLALGAEASIVGVIGEDEAGERLRERSRQSGANVSGLVADPSRPTTWKTRIVAHSQQMLRFDREAKRPVENAIEDRMLAGFRDVLAGAEAVILSDYEKGALTPRLLRAVIEESRAAGIPVCLDPKLKNWAHYRGVDVITPNQLEAERASGIEIADDAALDEAARWIRRSLDCRCVLVTRGEHGMSLLDDAGNLGHIPTVAREVYDVTGAGDTVIAALALAMAAGAGIADAAGIANYAAGIVVGKVGTATVSREELIRSTQEESTQEER
ncbi:MAG: D-glycero-beta-D-manno-heptose-7-phosphate kinase [Acidobacteria bacterium]|nr:D-glycero-beta-D-manno-heptose-7-phosphate kinase [Acidobacteriota bacterium]MCW5968744.1 D-glycero-beta-D-manno-heptose-7-phosphate kinase [Blastocatellales bacterium]